MFAGPGFVAAVYDDKRARDQRDAFRLYYFAARSPVRKAAKAVLWALAHRCDYRDGGPWRATHIATLAYESGLSRRATQDALRELESAGLITVEASEHPGSRDDGWNRYRIVLTPPLRAV